MKTKIKSQTRKPTTNDADLIYQDLRKRFERSKRRVHYLLAGLPPPPSLEDPEWLEKIYDRASEMVLPLKRKIKKRPAFSIAAKLGGLFAERKMNADLVKGQSLGERTETRPSKKLQKMVKRDLSRCIQIISEKLNDSPLNDIKEFLQGFAYGVECQNHKLESGQAIQANERWLIYDAILRNETAFKRLVYKRPTATEISKFILKKLPKPQQSNYTRAFGDFEKMTNQSWHSFVNRIYKFCKDIGIDVPPRGRPR